MIRVIIADDYPSIRIGVAQALKETALITVVSDAADPSQLINKLNEGCCDVLVTDFSMPCQNNSDGLIMLRRISTRFPKVRTVVMTTMENPTLCRRMLDSGVFGIINKSDDLSEIPEAIFSAFRSSIYLSKSIEKRISEGLEDAPPRNKRGTLISLSPKEAEVIRLIVNGMSATEVAHHLHRKINTISTQKHNAMRKLGITNDTELYAYAAKSGLIES